MAVGGGDRGSPGSLLAVRVDGDPDKVLGAETYLTTGITNAASEGNNRLIKLEARNAFGFRNRANQRLRSRCATTRRSQREAHPPLNSKTQQSPPRDLPE
ncbi:transposase [Streptomyces camponoticapitis]|uniref:transposase n=1 Tax=Streptomyces camponoticapitis TaxID=1616125 RepID=UPI003570B8C8